jgi:hypothetical protein
MFVQPFQNEEGRGMRAEGGEKREEGSGASA